MKMQNLTEKALSNYQCHLAIIQRMYLIGAMTQEKYTESIRSANTLWNADQKEITKLSKRSNIINCQV